MTPAQTFTPYVAPHGYDANVNPADINPMSKGLYGARNAMNANRLYTSPMSLTKGLYGEGANHLTGMPYSIGNKAAMSSYGKTGDVYGAYGSSKGVSYGGLGKAGGASGKGGAGYSSSGSSSGSSSSGSSGSSGGSSGGGK